LQYTIEGGTHKFVFEHDPAASNVSNYMKYMYHIIDSKEEYRDVVIDFFQVNC